MQGLLNTIYMKRILFIIGLLFALLSLRYIDNTDTIEVSIFLIGCSLFTLFTAFNINHLKH